MDGAKPKSARGGVNQSGVRNFNERLLLSLLQRRGAQAGIALARDTGLSPQTVSVILRKLEQDGVLRRGEPQRGKVGKPSIPMELDPDGVLSLGLRIGRRSADLLLLDLVGAVRAQIVIRYEVPLPDAVLGFLETGIDTLLRKVPQDVAARLCGIGIAAPFELWKWNDLMGVPEARLQDWRDVDFAAQVAEVSDLPLFEMNDATAACRAEHLFGTARGVRDYAYFFVGSFVGGGVVINDTVFEGNQGNAGALGSLRSTGPLGESRQLIDVASIHLLEHRLVQSGRDPQTLWHEPQDWSGLAREVEAWIGETAQELAKAALSVCAVIDFEAVLIDGAFPAAVRAALVERVRRYLATQDTRGLIVPRIEEGSIGRNARAIGAASGPIFAQFLLDRNAGLGGAAGSGREG